MSRILVSGLINLEITLQVESFPIPYFPVRYPFFGVNSTVSGVGYNVAKALTSLGDEVRFLSITGRDLAGRICRESMKESGVPLDSVVNSMEQTPHSVILFERSGRRQINVDLKDIQEQVYPPELFEEAARSCDMAALCNINFSRPYLEKALKMGIPVATDVHAISHLDDDYNRDFMRAAEILFMSDELLPVHPSEWVRRVMRTCGAGIIVVGMGSEGALLSVRKDNFVERIPPVKTREVKNSIGAGDALFSAFVHFYLKSGDPYDSIEKASLFASYKIGESGAAMGLLDEAGLLSLFDKVNPNPP